MITLTPKSETKLDIVPLPITFTDILDAVLFFNFVNPDLYTDDILLRPVVIPRAFTGNNLLLIAPNVASNTVSSIISYAVWLCAPVIFSSVFPINVDEPEPIAAPATGPKYNIATPPIAPSIPAPT